MELLRKYKLCDVFADNCVVINQNYIYGKKTRNMTSIVYCLWLLTWRFKPSHVEIRAKIYNSWSHHKLLCFSNWIYCSDQCARVRRFRLIDSTDFRETNGRYFPRTAKISLSTRASARISVNRTWSTPVLWAVCSLVHPNQTWLFLIRKELY